MELFVNSDRMRKSNWKSWLRSLSIFTSLCFGEVVDANINILKVEFSKTENLDLEEKFLSVGVFCLNEKNLG